MRTLLLTFVLCVFVACLQVEVSGEETSKWRNPQKEAEVQACLTEVELDVSVLGITKIEELSPDSMIKIRDIAEPKRDCFMACLFKKTGEITADGKVSDKLPNADPIKKFTGTTFQDEANKCRSETEFCKIGGCLYKLYHIM